ncbi:helix-turn-helix domain-containing protein [Longitalea luteola]|uniref:helix-turn-helix domain-containing protein n=1 Tax=Longitalea luteola TaxID=2812563 RepID=UPI001A974160|nr:AraC family transcriptional regulator [Longitalea luteola]
MLNNEFKRCSVNVLLSVESIKKHIDDDPFQFKTTADLIRHVSKAHRNSVEKVFKEVYGTGVKEYQVKKRLEASKTFLREGMEKDKIASKCFYSSQTAYCRAFKSEFNVTPTEWQVKEFLTKQ